ncbi:MAG: methyltransferase domain-containing protein [Paracoccaceae bacterium]
MLNETTVIDAYRLILGRAPENDSVVAFHRRHPSEAALRRALLESEEFDGLLRALRSSGGRAGPAAEAPRAEEAEEEDVPVAGLSQPDAPADRTAPDLTERAPPAPDAADAPDAPPIPPAAPKGQGILPPVPTIDIETEGEIRDRLWARVAASWAALGETAAHWSVLTHEAFRPENLEANRAEFEASAEVEGLLMDAALARVPGAEPEAMRALEVGCGVGRATRALARRFGTVTGVDISPSHLDIARAELDAAGFDNVTLRQMREVGDYATLPEVDFFYSRIVLQHNPPPVQAAILDAVLGRLAPGGIALFQVVTHGRGYRFEAAKNAATGEKGMEMHVLPQPAVFAILARAGLAPLEVQEDHAAGRDSGFRSHLFLARKA